MGGPRPADTRPATLPGQGRVEGDAHAAGKWEKEKGWERRGAEIEGGDFDKYEFNYYCHTRSQWWSTARMSLLMPCYPCKPPNGVQRATEDVMTGLRMPS